MGKRKRRKRGDDSSSSYASSSDGMSTEETRSRRSSGKTKSKEMLKELKDEIKWMFKEHKDELKDEFKRMFKELKDEHKDETSGMKKELKELNENHIVLCRQLEQLIGSSGDVPPAPRSEPINEMELPTFRLEFTSKVKDKVEKGKNILAEDGGPIKIALYDGATVIANDEPLASATVKMFVLNGKFNKGDTKYNWSKEDFQESTLKPVSGGKLFNLAGGKCSIRDAKISENSSNKKVRLGVKVVSATKEPVREGLSSHFTVRDPPKKSKPAPIDNSSTPRNNTEQATGEENFGNILTSGIFTKSAPVDCSSTPGNNTEQATGSSTPGNSTHGANLQFPIQPLVC